MVFQVLEMFSTAWRQAAHSACPPTLAALEAAGVALDHPGFALIGRCTVQGKGKSQDTNKAGGRTVPMFRFLRAGSNHMRFGGHVMAGHRFDEIAHPAHLASVLNVYQTVCEESSLHSWSCMNMARNAEPISYTRVVGAIADDVGDGRCAAGVWVWHQPAGKGMHGAAR